MRLVGISMGVGLAVVAALGCSTGSSGDGDDDAGTGLDGAADGGGEQDGGGTAGEGDADAGSETDGASCTWETLRAETLDSGETVWDGVTLGESTPIGDILGSPSSYEGQVVQIEGYVAEICTSQGCWVLLTDPRDSSQLVLKVVDGQLDFRTVTEAGEYGIGEGPFTEAGAHGPQVSITGAMFSSASCL